MSNDKWQMSNGSSIEFVETGEGKFVGCEESLQFLIHDDMSGDNVLVTIPTDSLPLYRVWLSWFLGWYS